MVNKLIKFECARAHMMRLEEHGTTGFYVKVREVNFDSYFNETIT